MKATYRINCKPATAREARRVLRAHGFTMRQMKIAARHGSNVLCKEPPSFEPPLLTVHLRNLPRERRRPWSNRSVMNYWSRRPRHEIKNRVLRLPA